MVLQFRFDLLLVLIFATLNPTTCVFSKMLFLQLLVEFIILERAHSAAQSFDKGSVTYSVTPIPLRRRDIMPTGVELYLQFHYTCASSSELRGQHTYLVSGFVCLRFWFAVARRGHPLWWLAKFWIIRWEEMSTGCWNPARLHALYSNYQGIRTTVMVPCYYHVRSIRIALRSCISLSSIDFKCVPFKSLPCAFCLSVSYYIDNTWFTTS